MKSSRIDKLIDKMAVIGLILISASALMAATNGPLKRYSQAPHMFADRSDNPIWLQGLSVCCTDSKANGWPWFSNGIVDKLASHNLNWVHMRMGPFTKAAEGDNFQAYQSVGGKYDLNRFDEGYFNRAKDLIGYARSKGVYVEVDVVDGWVLRHGLGPWSPGVNTENKDYSSCQGEANQHQKDFVRKVVQTVGGFDNVIYQISNEPYTCDEAWAKSVNDVLRDEMKNKGFAQKLVSTNSHNQSEQKQSWIDYINTHEDGGQAKGIWWGKPTLTNEYGDGQSLDVFTLRQWKDFVSGTFYLYWRGGNNGTDSEKAFDRMQFFMNFINKTDFSKFISIASDVAGIKGKEYVAYISSGNSKTIELEGSGSYSVEWLHTHTGKITKGENVQGGKREIKSAESGPQVLHLKALNSTRLAKHSEKQNKNHTLNLNRWRFPGKYGLFTVKGQLTSESSSELSSK